MIDFSFINLHTADSIVDFNDNISDYPSTAIEMTCFIMPIKLIINKVDFFRYNEDKFGYLDMPIINLASDGIIHLRRLYRTKMEKFVLPEGTGDLIFRLDNNDIVSIDFPQRKIHVSVPYEELSTAFLQFREKVRSFLRERVPDLVQHPYWGKWVAGEEFPEDISPSSNTNS